MKSEIQKATDTANANRKRYQLSILQELTGLTWTAEHKFCDSRKWRFDFACLPIAVAIEVEGGVFTQGRHSRGAGMIADMEKYNTAQLFGWTVLRYTPQQFSAGVWVDDVAYVTTLNLPQNPEWHEDMMHAFDTAVNCMESEEFGGDNAERQEAAYREVATRLRRMAARYNRTHGITK